MCQFVDGHTLRAGVEEFSSAVGQVVVDRMSFECVSQMSSPEEIVSCGCHVCGSAADALTFHSCLVLCYTVMDLNIFVLYC